MATRKNNTRIKATAIDVPKTQAEAELLLLVIGRAQREVKKIERDMNEHMAEIKDDFEKAAQPHNNAIVEKFQALHTWAEAHRDDLLIDKSKTAKLSSGELRWRWTPKKVTVKKVEDVISRLKRLKLNQFIRTKEEIDKEAILGDEKAIEDVKGLSVSQKEEFVAIPFETNIERAEAVKK